MLNMGFYCRNSYTASRRARPRPQRNRTTTFLKACNCSQLILFIWFCDTLYLYAVFNALKKLKPAKTRSTMPQEREFTMPRPVSQPLVGRQKLA